MQSAVKPVTGLTLNSNNATVSDFGEIKKV